MQQVDDPPYLTVGTEVSAKYKGAFCEAKVRKVVRNIKCKVAYKQQGLGSGVVSDDQIKGALRVGATVEVKHPERKEYVEATLTKIQDCSQYTVVFDDGDITTLRRSALCLKSGRHFNESETLDQLPLTHPEHFGNPVIGGRRGRRSRHLLPDESSDEEDEPTTHSRSNASDKEENIGKVVCVETSDNKKKNPKENWFPGLVVAPTAQDTVRIRVKDEYLVRSFKDGRYYTVPKKEATEFTRDSVNKSEAAAVSAAIEYMDNDVLPPHWDREALFGTSGSCSDSDQELETDSSDDEPTEEKDHFVAQLYKFMDDRGTPLNKAPSITNRDVDLYRLFRAVQKLHGYNRVTSQNQWKQIALRLGFSPATASITNLVKQAYKKFLFSFEEFNRKLGCTMVPHPKTSRTKGRSLVRASSVQSPKLSAEKEKLLTAKEKAASAAAADASSKAAAIEASNSAMDESDNTSESSATESAVLRPAATKRKGTVGGKVKALVDKFEEKEKEREKEQKASAGASASSKGGGESSSGGGSSSTTASKKEEATAKKEKLAAKAKPTETATVVVVEKRGRKRKDADSVDSKKDERESTTTGSGSSSVVGGGSSGGVGSGSAGVKQEKQSSSGGAAASGSGGGAGVGGSSSSSSGGGNGGIAAGRKEDGGPPISVGGSSGGGGGGNGGSGNGSGPGSGGGRSVSPSSGPGSGASVPDFPIEVGDKLKVYYDEQKVTYEAKVIEIAKQEGNPIYLVHYTGWNTRYDEWVRKERIAENLTNSKTKKGKSSTSTPSGKGTSATTAAAGTTPGPNAAGDKTPKVGKRSRGNSKGEQSGGPTPRSTTPNVGRNKSPATPSHRRPLTRGGSSAATGASSSLSTAGAGGPGGGGAAGRRTSNNTDISSSLSVPTDPDNTSDTDSDEPMLKKCTTNSTSSTTSSNSSISMSSTSTKVSTTAEAGSSSDAAAISDEFSNGASKGGGGGAVVVGGGGGGGGRDYDLNQIRSELKGFKELKSPGSPASDTTTTTTTTTTTGPATGEAPNSTSSATDVPKHLIPKQEPNALGSIGGTSDGTKDTVLVAVKKEEVSVKEEESTVTEEDDEPEKSSESETLSEEDSSQSSNKAFSSSPITTMVDSDTAEAPLATAERHVLSPKISVSPPPSMERDDSSSTEPLSTVATKAADAKASLAKGTAASIKKEPSETVTTPSAHTPVGKPPVKTYGTAATIIANSEKMAFCTVRDVSAEAGGESLASKETPALESPQKNPPQTTPGGVSPSLTARLKTEEKTTPGASTITPTVVASRTTAGKSVPSSPSAAGAKDDSTPSTPSVIIATGSTGSTAARAIKSPKASPSTAQSVAQDEGKLHTPATSSASTSQTITPTSTTTSYGGSLRADKKPFASATGPAGPTAMEKKISLGRDGTSAFTSPAASSAVSSLKHSSGTSGGSLLGEKKHFSSSTLTPAQNKLLSKEALSIKSIFESTANRMDEKISDVYEFEDEYDDQDTPSVSSGAMGASSGTAISGAAGGVTSGGTRKLVSDVPPAEVVSSLGITSTTGPVEDKRKKPLQRKSLAADPLDTSFGSTGSTSYSAKRTKKVSPVKSEPTALVGVDGKSPKGPAAGSLRREPKDKEDQKEQHKPSVELESTKPGETSVDSLKEKSALKATLTATTAAPSQVFVQTTPIKSDSTFDVLRKSPSFNLVATPAPGTGTKEDSFRSLEDSEAKSTAPLSQPLPPATTTPGIFTPVISAATTSAGNASERSISSGAIYAPGKGPSSSVLLAKAGVDGVTEEPTLENCKKYFNDMNFEFDAPTVKKPPSIADKVLKALSQQNQQQQQQQQQQHQQQTIKIEKPDFPKYMPSSLHLLSLPSSSAPLSSTSAPHTPIKSEVISGPTPSYVSPLVGANLPAKSVSSEPLPHAPNKILEAKKKEPTEDLPPTVVVKSDPKPSNASPQTTIVAPPTAGGHKVHLLDQLPTARSNDLTESIRKLDPDPRFHDDESTDSNDSEHRLIIEDAESQGSGDPAHTPSMPGSTATTSTTTPATPVTAAVIVHYDSKQPGLISAKKELFEDKPRVTAPAAASAASITHEMASAASAAAVAAVAEKEKLILRQDRLGGSEDAMKPTGAPEKKPPTSAKQSLLETIIQMNTASHHDRLPPSTIGRKVYAEPPLVPPSASPSTAATASSSSSFLPPQNIQTATDLKPVPMDLEPPVVTITIGGNTTISSTSQGGQAGGVGAAGGSFASNLQQQTLRSGKMGTSGGGGESAVDTPNSSPRDSVSQDETHDHESSSPAKKRRQRKPSEEPTLKRRRTANTSLGGYGSGANNGSSSGYGRSQRGLTTSNATDSEDNSDSIAAFHRSASSSLIFVGSKTGRPCQYNFLVNLDPALNNNQRIAIIKKKIQELRKTYNAIKAELASIDRRRKKLRRRERENKKQAKLNSAGAGNN
uniref:ARID domain-containing protein n=1 Tax=Anopheles dirus TaxID=7168 RepID=A0A182NHT6_9DIPT